MSESWFNNVISRANMKNYDKVIHKEEMARLQDLLSSGLVDRIIFDFDERMDKNSDLLMVCNETATTFEFTMKDTDGTRRLFIGKTFKLVQRVSGDRIYREIKIRGRYKELWHELNRRHSLKPSRTSNKIHKLCIVTFNRGNTITVVWKAVALTLALVKMVINFLWKLRKTAHPRLVTIPLGHFNLLQNLSNARRYCREKVIALVLDRFEYFNVLEKSRRPSHRYYTMEFKRMFSLRHCWISLRKIMMESYRWPRILNDLRHISWVDPIEAQRRGREGFNALQL